MTPLTDAELKAMEALAADVMETAARSGGAGQMTKRDATGQLPDTTALAEALKLSRELAGMTQKDLIVAMGKGDKSWISDLENGRKVPSTPTLILWGKCTRTPAWKLLRAAQRKAERGIAVQHSANCVDEAEAVSA